MKLASSLLVVAVSLLALPASAQPSAAESLAPLFPHEAEVRVAPGNRLVRLPLSAEVLREAGHDLGDVRLFDSDGREVPFLIDRASDPLWPRTRTTEWLAAPPLEVLQHKKRRLYHEELVIAAPPDDDGWTLELRSWRAHFVRAIRIEDAAAPPGATPFVSGTVFRLQDPLREGVRIALPARLPERLRVVLSGEDAYLEPTFAFVAERPPRALPITVPLSARPATAEHGVSTIVLDRPPGVLPHKLRLSTSTRALYRTVVVRDGGAAGGGRELGRGVVFRVDGQAGVEQLEIGLARASGDRLELTVEDGDSPPLADVRIEAIVDAPVLVFALDGDGLLRFGGRRAHAPRYDLQQLVGSEPARHLREHWREAELSAARPNQEYVAAPPLAALAKPGAAVERERYAFRRALDIGGPGEGAARTRLDASALARARVDLADLRVVDAQDRQWPYLLERDGQRLEVPLALESPRRASNGTRHLLRMPEAPLAVVALRLEIDAPWVDRAYRVLTRDVDGDHEIARGRLTLRPGEEGPIELPLSGAPLEELTLEVEDGGDAPLALTRAQAVVAGAELYLAAAPGRYWLLSGDPAALAPDYELAAARALVHALPSESAVLGAPEPNPSFRPSPGPTRKLVLLWGAVALAVIVLGATTLRLAARPATAAG